MSWHILDTIREDSIGYTNVTGDTTGAHIAESIIERLQAMSLDPLNLRAQSYDGTGMYTYTYTNA